MTRKKRFNHPGFRHKTDRAHALTHFIDHINRSAHAVVEDLYVRVLPSYMAALIRAGSPNLTDLLSQGNTLASSLGLPWDSEVWHDCCAWAERWHLLHGMTLSSFDQRKTLAILEQATDYPQSPEQRLQLKKSATVTQPFPEDATKVVFGVPMLIDVRRSLREWVDTDVTKRKARLGGGLFPGLGRGPQTLTLKDIRAGIDLNQRWLVELVWRMMGPAPGPSTYSFTSLAWNVCDGQTRAQAREAILEELARQVDERLDAHIQTAEQLPYLEVRSDKREDEHYHWLVQYQVLEESCGQIAKAFGTSRQT
jgi:hypothetical protein